MARYLSADWFALVAAHSRARSYDPAVLSTHAPDVVLEQEVRDTPDGVVTYRVEVWGPDAAIVWPVADGAAAPDLRITTDWETAVAVARGDLSTQLALMEGRLRFRGRPDRLAAAAGALVGVDPVPEAVRAATTFEGS